MRSWILELLAPCLVMTGFLGGVLALGQWAQQQMQTTGACTLSFQDIDCAPPPGLTTSAFLSEVQYLAGLPDQLSAHNDDLTAQLARAFEAHPWVEQVQRIEIHPTGRSAGAPSGYRAHIELIHRQPVLAVRMRPSQPHAQNTSSTQPAFLLASELPAWRAVDRHGMLLPASACCDKLPRLQAQVGPPEGPPGTPWGAQEVEKAALTAAFLEPYLGQLHLDRCRLKLVGNHLYLTGPGVRILWGSPPGQEHAREAPAAVKLERLLELQQTPQGLVGVEHDVRLRAYNGRFPLIACACP
jgi:hypothetical protein